MCLCCYLTHITEISIKDSESISLPLVKEKIRIIEKVSETENFPEWAIVVFVFTGICVLLLVALFIYFGFQKYKKRRNNTDNSSQNSQSNSDTERSQTDSQTGSYSSHTSNTFSDENDYHNPKRSSYV